MDDLEKAAVAYRRAEKRTEEARVALHAAILEALAAGRTQTEVARISGYTREHLRQMVKKAE